MAEVQISQEQEICPVPRHGLMQNMRFASRR